MTEDPGGRPAPERRSGEGPGVPAATTPPQESGDAVVAVLFVVMLVLLGAGLTGAHWVFAYGMVAWLAALVGLGFVRRGERWTWVAAALASAGFFVGMTGLLLNESAVVRSAADTVLGFHPGTAFLVYGIWLPGFFTLAVSFALLFDRLAEPRRRTS